MVEVLGDCCCFIGHQDPASCRRVADCAPFELLFFLSWRLCRYCRPWKKSRAFGVELHEMQPVFPVRRLNRHL